MLHLVVAIQITLVSADKESACSLLVTGVFLIRFLGFLYRYGATATSGYQSVDLIYVLQKCSRVVDDSRRSPM